MKRLNPFIVLFLIVLLLSGCSNELKTENETLKAQVLELTAALEEIKNGAAQMIIEIRSLYENKNYDKVISTASTLHEKYKGVPEDIEAQGYVQQIQSERAAEQKRKEAEAAAQAAEAAKTAQDKIKSIIRVKKVYIFDKNSAGKVDIAIDWVNNSDKIIKYATFTVVPFNAVGDKVLDHGKYESEKRLKDTGPIPKGKGNGKNTYWDGWYNFSITEIRLIKIEIEYMDGTTTEIKGPDIKYAIY